MLNTENALFSAQDALVQGKFAHLQALVDLYQALGGGWQQGNAAGEVAVNRTAATVAAARAPHWRWRACAAGGVGRGHG